MNQSPQFLMSKPFDYKKFTLHYESVFTNPDISKEFQKFLQSEFNNEPFLFLEDVKNLKETKNFIPKTIEIIEKYIVNNAKCEVNISGKSKLSILQGYELQKLNLEEWKFEKSFDVLFDEISKILKEEMYHDPWKRFLRTKTCVKLMEKYKDDSTICSPQITEKFDYKDDYFNHPYIFKDDFLFAEELFKDNFDWEVRPIEFTFS
jgi:hypothetical protein